MELKTGQRFRSKEDSGLVIELIYVGHHSSEIKVVSGGNKSIQKGTTYPVVTNELIEALSSVYVPIDVARIDCTCGANHTSNPKFHLSYCEVLK